ncbi:hypothetical protein amrb99_84630 [Actinomadura sp. RB99]|nr:hypothetical protein [Actinomadura sp. RB99]
MWIFEVSIHSSASSPGVIPLDASSATTACVRSWSLSSSRDRSRSCAARSAGASYGT